MKLKTIACLLAILMILSVSACAQENEQPAENVAQQDAAQPTPNVAPEPEPESEPEPETVTVVDMDITLSFPFGERTGVFSGEMRDGLPHGHGEFTTVNEEGNYWIYTGEWLNGQFDGEGVTIWDFGQAESGIYRDSVLVEGMRVLADGQIEMIGDFGGAPTEMDIDEYRVFAAEFNDDIMELSILLNNTGQWMSNYWEALNGGQAGIDYEGMVESGFDWLERNADEPISREGVDVLFDDIVARYISSLRYATPGEQGDEITETIASLYFALRGLYRLITEPSGDLQGFARRFNTHVGAIVRYNEQLSLLT